MAAVGELLKGARGARSRRVVGEKGGMGTSVPQKLEEARNADLTLKVLAQAAAGYDLSPFEILRTALGISAEDVVSWVAGDLELRLAVERKIGRRVTVESVMPEGVDQLPEIVARLESVSSALGSMVVALEAGYERSVGGSNGLESLRESVGPMGGDNGDDLTSGALESPLTDPM
jgi:hypothetical protein